MAFRISVEKLEFDDGTCIDVRNNEIVVVTGANNAGKTTTLSTITRRLDLRHGLKSYPSKLVKTVDIRVEGNSDQYIEHLKAKYEFDEDDDRIKFEKGHSSDLKVETLRKRFEDNDIPNQVLSDLSLRLTAHARLGGNEYRDGVHAAADILFSDETKELRISEVFARAFGTDMVLERTRDGGTFKIADRKTLPKKKDLFTPESRNYYNSLPDVSDQGDGIRSFARMCLEVLVEPRNIVVIDEPELFLHPPQIRQLAKMITTDTPNSTQLFIATHSVDFVRAILEHASDRLKIIRLSRSPAGQRATEVDSEEIKNLWSDPNLSASGVLGALFHDHSVLCEGETDRKFFRALDDSIEDNSANSDLEYYSINGKDRILPIAKALKRLNVGVSAIVDIDILANKKNFHDLLEVFGGDFSAIESDFKRVEGDTRSRRREISGDLFRSDILEIANEVAGKPTVPNDTIQRIHSLLKKSSPWSQIKESGAAWFKGESYKAVGRLIDYCASVGLFINNQGELESLCREAPASNKNAWLRDVLQRNLKKDSALEHARTLLERVHSYAGSRST